MSNLSIIITESMGINNLLRDCYSYADDKDIDGRFEASIKKLKKSISAIDLCYKENVVNLNDTIDDYLKGYINYLKDYISMAESYRMAYITWRLGKNKPAPDEYEEIYSRMFYGYQQTNPGEKFSEDELIRVIRENSRPINKEKKDSIELETVSNCKVMYSIFISSTYEDLKEERLALMPALLSKRFIPIGMEIFHAAPVSQWDVITKMIDECDYYLLVVGGRYGSIDEIEGISYTEKEYNYAKSKGVPIIAFLPSNPGRLSFDKLDKDDLSNNLERLRAFKDKIQHDNKTVAFYENINDLKYQVSVSLDRLIEFAPRDGWIRRSEIMKNIQKDVDLQDKIETTKAEVTELKKELEGRPNFFISESMLERMKKNDIWLGSSDNADFGDEG